MHNFRNLEIWKRSISLVTEIYKLTNSFPQQERYGLISQMQRAAVSCPSNIAEGSAKSSEKDFARFLEISLGSLLELETELIVSFNLEYVDSIRFNEIQASLIELQKMINGFKNYLNKE